MSKDRQDRATMPEDPTELMHLVIRHYQATLLAAPVAVRWLAERGIADGEAADALGVGFADRSVGRSLPTGPAGCEVRERLKQLGILRSSGHERFRGCVVLPVREVSGRVVQCYGRRIQRPKQVPGQPSAEVMWLPSPPVGLWNPDALASPEVIVADSVLDALVWWSSGYRHVIAAGGPAGFPEGTAGLLADAGVRRVLLAQARTNGGNRAATAVAEQLMAYELECFRVGFPAGGDASTTADENTDAAAVLAERLRSAVWLGRGTAPSRRTRPATSGGRLPSPVLGSEPATLAIETHMPVAVVKADRVDDGPVPSPVPVLGSARCDVSVDGAELCMASDVLVWRVRGLDRVIGVGSLRVTVSVHHRETGAFQLDVVDLFSARSRNQFLAEVAAELGLGDCERLRRDMGRLLLACEDRVLDLQNGRVQAAPTMTAAAEHAALELLRDPRLLDRIGHDIAKLGVVGERDNALLAYLAALSRLLDAPLAVVIQSESASGKSTLVDAVLSLVPAEARVSVSAVTGQSLFYLAETAIAHKVLSVAEMQGALRATYALKMLTGDGELSIASTGKAASGGALVSKTYRVQGPVALFLTTTAAALDDELANRAVILGVDGEQTQTDAILAAQRHAHTLDGLIERHERQAIRELHANAQRLLEPTTVVIPFAPQLIFADRRMRARRDQPKLLTLIRTVALLHQHQRPRRRINRRGLELIYIEATLEDLATARRLAGGGIGRPDLADLGPQTRRLLARLDALVTTEARNQRCRREEIRLTRRQAREHTGWSDYAIRRHVARLVELEYAATHRVGNAFTYELLWSATDINDPDSDGHEQHDRAAVARPPGGDLAGSSWASRADLAGISSSQAQRS